MPNDDEEQDVVDEIGEESLKTSNVRPSIVVSNSLDEVIFHEVEEMVADKERNSKKNNNNLSSRKTSSKRVKTVIRKLSLARKPSAPKDDKE